MLARLLSLNEQEKLRFPRVCRRAGCFSTEKIQSQPITRLPLLILRDLVLCPAQHREEMWMTGTELPPSPTPPSSTTSCTGSCLVYAGINKLEYITQCCFSPPVNKFLSFFQKSTFLCFEAILGNCIQFLEGSQLYFHNFWGFWAFLKLFNLFFKRKIHF